MVLFLEKKSFFFKMTKKRTFFGILNHVFGGQKIFFFEFDFLCLILKKIYISLKQNKNFGKKSLTELEELVNVKGLNFGMDLSKYKLDKD